MKAVFLILFCWVFTFAYELNLPSNVSALKAYNGNLYVGTDKAQLFKFDIKNKKLELLTQLQRVKNYYQDDAFAQIYSIDVIDDQILFLSEGDYGSKDIWILKEGGLEKKLNKNSVKKVFFLDKNTILMAFIGSNIQSLDLNSLKIKEFDFSTSSLSDAVLDDKRALLALAFESGVIKLFDTKKWQVLNEFSKVHKDNIYQLDYKNAVIASCSTDKKVGIVKNLEEKFIENNFLIYACALSPSGALVAFNDSSKNLTQINFTKDLRLKEKLQSVDFMLEHIIFLSENELVLAGYNNKIIFWSLQ